MDSITIHPFRKNQAEAFPANTKRSTNSEVLRGAINPLIVSPLGLRSHAWSAMVSFAEALAAPVVTPASRSLSFPNTHDFHLGVSSAPYIKDADVVWSLSAMFRGIPSKASRRRTARLSKSPRSELQPDSYPNFQDISIGAIRSWRSSCSRRN